MTGDETSLALPGAAARAGGAGTARLPGRLDADAPTPLRPAA